MRKSAEKRGPDSPGPAGSALRLGRGCEEADGRTDRLWLQAEAHLLAEMEAKCPALLTSLLATAERLGPTQLPR